MTLDAEALGDLSRAHKIVHVHPLPDHGPTLGRGKT
jgi:hypothetical protein